MVFHTFGNGVRWILCWAFEG